jgi:hypothetical protein
MSPNPFSGFVGNDWPNTLWGYNQCDDTLWDVTFDAYNWSTTSSSILTVSSSGMSHGVGAGNAGVSTYIYAPVVNRYKCPYQTQYPGNGGGVYQPPSFNVAYSAYIPVDHVDGPASCTYQGQSYGMLYLGDANRGSYRTTESLWITPDLVRSSGFFSDTGETRNYGYGSPANGSTLSLLDEDNIQNDCYLWNNKGKADPSGFTYDVTFPYSNQGQVHFAGSSSNPLESQLARISWDMRTSITTSLTSSSTALVHYNHTCYPAHQIKVNGTVVYLYTPPRNDTTYLFNCLVLQLDKVTGSQSTATPVQGQYPTP